MSALGSGFLAHEEGVDYSVAGGAPNYAFTADAGADAAVRPLARDRIVFNNVTKLYRLTAAASTAYTLSEQAFAAHDQTINFSGADIALAFTGGVISGRQLPPTQRSDLVYRRSTRLYSASPTLPGYTLPYVGTEAHEQGSAMAYGQVVSPAGFLTGTVTFSGAPAARWVYAFDRTTGLQIGSALSDAGTGAFTIDGVLASTRALIVSVPLTSDADNAHVFDNVQPAT